MNPEKQIKEVIEIKFDGEDCSNSEEDTRADLVEKDWIWNEGSVNGLFRITAVQCPECDLDVKAICEEKKQQVEEVHNQGKDSDSKQKSLGDLN